MQNQAVNISTPTPIRLACKAEPMFGLRSDDEVELRGDESVEVVGVVDADDVDDDRPGIVH